MAENFFELVGRIGWIEIKYSDNGTAICRIFLGVKKSKDKWDNVPITFLQSVDNKNKVAENLAEQHKKGDYIRVKGVINIDKFTPKNGDKEVEKISLIGRSFNAVRFDEFEKRFVDV